jgi:transcriptional regulator with XRE-family HTH domain
MKRASIYSAEHAVLIRLLRELRLEAGLSQSQVAEHLRRPQTYVSAVELGERGLDLLQVREMTALYGMGFLAFVQMLEEQIAAAPIRSKRLRRIDASKAK